MKVDAHSLMMVTNNTAQAVQHNSHLIYSLLTTNHELVQEVKILQESVGHSQKALDNLSLGENLSIVAGCPTREQDSNLPAIVTSWLVIKFITEDRSTSKGRLITRYLE